MKKILGVFLTVVLAALAVTPMFSAAAAEPAGQAELIEGTYVPDQVVVMFRDGSVSADSAPPKGDLAAVGAEFGGMMSAFSSEDTALAAALDEEEILSRSLGDDFVLEDTLVFADSVPQSDGLAPVGASAGAGRGGDLTVALVSSEKYDAATMIKKLSSDPNIAAVEPNQYIHLTDFDDYSLNDTYASYLYQLNSPAAKNTGGESVEARGTDPEKGLSMNTASAWPKLTGEEEEIVIAVVDTGVLDTHEDLRDRMWTNPGDIGLKGEHGYNFFENNEDSAYDDVGHGTHCAGVIAAEANNGLGVAGAAYGADVRIMALRILGETAPSAIYTALGAYDYILKAKQNGVNVVASNNSWGGSAYSTILDEAIDRLGEAGILTLVAAGNDSHDLDRVWDFPAASQSGYTVIVGAADINGKPTNFSNYGKTTVDLYAPGMNLLSTVSYESYFPSIWSAEKIAQTTEYYGEFGPDTLAEGTVTPSTGKAGEGVKPFGSLKYVKQCCLYDPEATNDEAGIEIADDAELELEIVSSRHFLSDAPYRLKITIHNAQFGEEYFLYFPYEKDPLTTGDDNTLFSALYETGETEEGAHKSRISVGDVYEDEDGLMVVNNGGLLGSYISYDRIGIQRHPTNGSAVGAEEGLSKLLSADEAQGKQIGFGMSISCIDDDEILWDEGEVHDLSMYLDSIAISKPGVGFDGNEAYDVMSGTSMACPAATGAVALLALLYPREEEQSGAEYAQALREKLFSCVRTTDEFAELCSTGGYIDFSLLDAQVPSVANAVCDADNETVTLYGENLTEDNTLTYRRIPDGSEAAALPDEMTLVYSDDGKTLVIQNAKPLFSTYTEFIVTTPSGVTGKGKFFLVKGQRQFEKIGSKIEQSDAFDVPYLITDADGGALYGYDYMNDQLVRFVGDKYYVLPDTDIILALKNHLADGGMSMYDLLNNEYYMISSLNTGYPLVDGDILYEFVAFKDYSAYMSSLYLGQIDLSDEAPRWTFKEVDDTPREIPYSVYKPVTMAIYQGKIYAFSAPDEDGVCAVCSLADDGTWAAEPEMPRGSNCPMIKESNGKLYYMLGTYDDPSLSYDDVFNKDVYAFDGEKWEKVGSIPFIGRYYYDQYGAPILYEPVATVKNGFVFIGASADGGGNAFLYDTGTNQVEPLYYTADDTVVDGYSQYASCVATRDGIYYIRYCSAEFVFSGYELYLLPVESGAYESAFEDGMILGDADGSGKVTILDAAAIQRTLVDLPTDAFSIRAADADGDGMVTILDATAIQRWLAGLSANENIGKPVQ